MKAGVDPLDQMEDDFHILISRLSTHLLTVSHFFLLLIRQRHHRCPYTLSLHILSSLDTIHHSPILIIHHLLSSLLYMSFRLSFMLSAWKFMTTDDITSLCGSVDESSDMHTKQMSSLHHHHAEMMDIHHRRFMSLKTFLDDFET